MPSLVLVGAQWGDEGKGKLVDYLAPKANWVVRFQGGNNAGHTVIVGEKTYKLSLIPSGILHTETCCALGAGVVIDPEVLLSEMAKLNEDGVSTSPERLIVDRDAHLILEYHKLIDVAREHSMGAAKIGTTGRGIGPAYEDRAARMGVRMADLFDLGALKKRLREITDQKNLYLSGVLGSATVADFDQIWQVVERAAEKLCPHVRNVSLLIDQALQNGKKVLFEGAQGTLLDQMHGTVPFVTSSNTVAGAAATGTGIGPNKIDYVLGIVKAYTTRVGSGPFPTELNDKDGDHLCEKGREFGTVTGRKRRCGWFDGVAMRRAVRLNGINSFAITKLDVLSGLDTLKICTKYKLDGEYIDDVPPLASESARVQPEYIELAGWKEDISTVKSWQELPEAAKRYLSTISDVTGCQISVLSIGPDRDSTIFSDCSQFIRNF
ncbi:MAG: adenylosuccinate synthase [Bdellovibrionota bacterium]|jgi:adenylosuccinate synthase